jgi:hypothetical protein
MRSSFLLVLIPLLFAIPPQAAAWQQNSNPVPAADKAQAAAPTANNSGDAKLGEKVKAVSSPATGQTPAPAAVAGSSQPGSTGENPSAIRAVIPSPENEKLRGQIQNTLRNEPSLAGSRLDVAVTDSEIELSGSVPTGREKEAARRLAQSYDNNRRVVDSKVNVRSGATAQHP